MSIGELMFFGGIGGAIMCLLFLIITLSTAKKKRHAMIDKIQKGLE